MLHLPNVRTCRFAVIILGVGLFTAAPVASAAEPSTRLGITVLGPRSLPAKGLSAVRTPLGIPNDYKPFVTR
ncbi:MAG: hypothetical protein VB861_19095, partial [Planctomycetaceae bacterium]